MADRGVTPLRTTYKRLGSNQSFELSRGAADLGFRAVFSALIHKRITICRKSWLPDDWADAKILRAHQELIDKGMWRELAEDADVIRFQDAEFVVAMVDVLHQLERARGPIVSFNLDWNPSSDVSAPEDTEGT